MPPPPWPMPPPRPPDPPPPPNPPLAAPPVPLPAPPPPGPPTAAKPAAPAAFGRRMRRHLAGLEAHTDRFAALRLECVRLRGRSRERHAQLVLQHALLQVQCN